MLDRKDREWELRVLVNTYPDQVIAQYLRLTGQETFAAPIEATLEQMVQAILDAEFPERPAPDPPQD
jgi:hypothetical protein